MKVLTVSTEKCTKLGPVPSQRGGVGALTRPKQSSKPPNRHMKH